MSSVIICQGASSAILYVQESRRRGFEPIIVNPPEFNPGDKSTFNKIVGEENLRYIEMKSMDEYSKVLEEVKKLDPVCVVCGSSVGTTVSDMLGRDLGLRHNDPDTTWRRDTKDGMHLSLKEAGIRYIRTAELKSKEDVKEFWKNENIKKAIIKFAGGAGSVGNKVCETLQESLDYFDVISNGVNIWGKKDKILIQEFIEGDEYVVDTVSCEGHHTVSAIWKYNKIITKDGSIAYDETRLVVTPEPGMQELVKYAYKVLDATGFEYGPCHGEYKVDDDGPVLIETNPRPHGTALNAEYLDEFLDNHITDLALDAYLSPETFNLRASMPYRPKKYALFKHLISPKDCDINLVALRNVLNHMKSYRYSSTFIGDEIVHVPKTMDSETTPAILKLCNSDYGQLRKDSDFLFTLETKYFDLLASGDKIIERVEVNRDLDKIANNFLNYWRILIVKEGEEYALEYGKRISSKANSNGYDALIYADASECKLADRLDSIVVSTKRLSESGVAIIMPEVYQNLPYKSATIEIALNLAGCTIEIPSRHPDVVIATRYI